MSKLNVLTNNVKTFSVNLIDSGNTGIEGVLTGDGENVYYNGIPLGGSGINLDGIDNTSILTKQNGELYGSTGFSCNLQNKITYNNVNFITYPNGNVFTIVQDENDLYIGGNFSSIGDININNIAKYNIINQEWSSLGDGVSGEVKAILIDGNDIYVGGNFTNVGSVNANYIAKWNKVSQTWNSVGDNNLNGEVTCIVSKDNNLYIGSSSSENFLVKIDKTSGSYNTPVYIFNVNEPGYVSSIVVNGNDMYIAGSFTNIDTFDGPVANNIFKYNLDTLVKDTLDDGIISDEISSIILYNGDLYVGVNIFGVSYFISKWNESSWVSLEETLNSDINKLTLINDKIYVGGNFTNFLQIWNLTVESWQPFPNDLNNEVFAITPINNDIYVGGSFNNYITRYEGEVEIINNININGFYNGNGLSLIPQSEAPSIQNFNSTLWYNQNDNTLMLGATGIGPGSGIQGPTGFLSISGTTGGDYVYWNGSTWAVGTTNIKLGSGAAIGGQIPGSIAIGPQAAYQGQNSYSIAIGSQAAYDSQSFNCIAIGYQAGYQGQSENSIAIGNQTGYNLNNFPNEKSITIGYRAGYNNTGQNNIILNATNNSLDAVQNSSLYINPIRNDNISSTNILAYNTSTKEVVYLNSALGPTGPTGIRGPTGTSAPFPNPVNNPGGATGIIYFDSIDNSYTYDTSGKTFVIDNPCHEDKYLVHACLEGPEVGVYYRGIGEIIEDCCYVELPKYVSFIATDLTPHITPVYNGTIRNISTTLIENNKFIVYGNPGKFTWIVYGKRGDVNVEPSKKDYKMKGDGPYKYLDNS